MSHGVVSNGRILMLNTVMIDLLPFNRRLIMSPLMLMAIIVIVMKIIIGEELRSSTHVAH